MKYGEYFKRKLKAKVLIGLGSLSMIFGLFSFIISWFVALVLLVVGGMLIYYGRYKLNELDFEREDSGHRVYHHRGAY